MVMAGFGDRAVQVVLAGISSQYVHSALAPWCLKAGLAAYAQTAHRALVVEGSINEPAAAVAERIIASAPDVLGISCYIWNIAFVGQLLPALRAALPACVIVLGGPEVSHNVGEVLNRHPQTDYVLAGEGELPFARLLDALYGQGELAEVPGLCYRQGEGLVISPTFVHDTMQPSPYCPEYLEALKGRIAYLETSRGCPYACAFCLSGRGEGLRQAPLERAFSEIMLLARSGTRTVKLVDRTFNADRKRAAAILGFIREQAEAGQIAGVTFHFEIAGDLLDEETLALVADSPKGLFQFEIGLQSMDEATLRLVRRKTDMGFLQRQVRRLIACGRAHVHLDLIAGLPGEDLAAFARSFDAAYALGPHALQLGFLKLIHGSAMREEPEAYPCRFDEAPPYQVQATPWLTEADFEVLRITEMALDRLHNAGRFVRTLRYLMEEAGQRPFALFHQLGQAIQGAAGEGPLSLDQLTEAVYEALCKLLPGHAAHLRDAMLYDRIASTKTSLLPGCLKRRDSRFHQVKRALAQRFPRTTANPRAIGFLYAGDEDQVVWCDYEGQDPVTGQYPVNILPVQDLLL